MPEITVCYTVVVFVAINLAVNVDVDAPAPQIIQVPVPQYLHGTSSLTTYMAFTWLGIKQT